MALTQTTPEMSSTSSNITIGGHGDSAPHARAHAIAVAIVQAGTGYGTVVSDVALIYSNRGIPQ